MKTEILKDVCISCGLCPSISPDLYVMEDDGKAGTLKKEVPEELESEAKEAAESCPVSAITIE